MMATVRLKDLNDKNWYTAAVKSTFRAVFSGRVALVVAQSHLSQCE